ncbi:hypothetical protein SCP_1601640 [Sparassis crispa]|uniref:Uncharacterized protein n=1 Tax=Sparassis crispa TaxID=139825 RepID=A0A401H512_9APHY|nr:hypothetical protein SCP_1601640 [Sparassis crispa]GBE89502.1 hypothetical protein SCP_1601640 [Sparassis crispa]
MPNPINRALWVNLNDEVPFEAVEAPSSKVEREPTPAATPVAESPLPNELASEAEIARNEPTELPVEDHPEIEITIAIEETVTTGSESRVKDEL